MAWYYCLFFFITFIFELVFVMRLICYSDFCRYPIYRIPTGPTLKDLDACFLTYHCLHTPVGGNVLNYVVFSFLVYSCNCESFTSLMSFNTYLFPMCVKSELECC